MEYTSISLLTLKKECHTLKKYLVFHLLVGIFQGWNGLISYIDFNEFIIISLDDSKKKISQEQLDKINELLTYNKPVIISMHIPIMSKHNEIEMKQYDSYFVINQFDTDEVTAKFIDLVINEHGHKRLL